jgi:RNA 3'-terminal phosphate cyclase (ATP)
MLVIDGSRGEGGGQILRTALSLSMVTGTAVRVERIRAGRAKPGLMRQHLVCVRAAQAVCGARVDGDAPGSTTVTFRPGAIRAGAYRFAIGSAGSTTLVLQTLLPALLLADGPSELMLEGGTHNDLAPTVDFIQLAFLPVLAAMGAAVKGHLERFGFYPAGGGAWRVMVEPWRDRRPLRLVEAHDCSGREALVTSCMVPGHVARRELAVVQAGLGWSVQECRSREVRSEGPGNLISLRLHGGGRGLVVEAIGRHGVSAERVAGNAVAALGRVLAAGVPVDEHLADQLLLPMALGLGGEFRTLRPTGHTLTNMEVIRAFTGRAFEVRELGPDDWIIRLSQAPVGASPDG